jgi:predicted LPLAT superfamily acyltransferase
VYFILTSISPKRASKSYLEKVLNRKPKLHDIFKHFYAFARVSTDRIFFLKGKTSKFEITLHNNEIFDELSSSNKGCVLMVSHVGSFEAMRVLATNNTATDIHILMDTEHSQKAQALLSSLNPDMADRIIDSNQAPAALALRLKEIIEAGGMVGIMVDRATKDEQVNHLELFNTRCQFPVTPWLLGIVLQAPIIGCFATFEGLNRYNIDFIKISDGKKVSRKQRTQQIKDWQKTYVDKLENILKTSPYNWFNFYEFWNNDSTNNH